MPLSALREVTVVMLNPSPCSELVLSETKE